MAPCVRGPRIPPHTHTHTLSDSLEGLRGLRAVILFKTAYFHHQREKNTLTSSLEESTHGFAQPPAGGATQNAFLLAASKCRNVGSISPQRRPVRTRLFNGEVLLSAQVLSGHVISPMVSRIPDLQKESRCSP